MICILSSNASHQIQRDLHSFHLPHHISCFQNSFQDCCEGHSRESNRTFTLSSLASMKPLRSVSYFRQAYRYRQTYCNCIISTAYDYTCNISQVGQMRRIGVWRWRNNWQIILTLITLAFSLYPLYFLFKAAVHCENKEQEMPFNECFNLAAGLVSITGSYQR